MTGYEESPDYGGPDLGWFDVKLVLWLLAVLGFGGLVFATTHYWL